jgi:polyisoprenyl-phosphate glycosyltransferase
VSVVVPVYCNRDSLQELGARYRAVRETLVTMGCELHMVFVDDGSTDESLQEILVIKQSMPGVTVVKLTRNFGANEAVRAGLRYVEGEAVVVTSADLQDPPDLIVRMVEKWQRGAKYVICTRRSRSDPPLSRWLAAVYYFMVRTLVAPDYPRLGFDSVLLDKSVVPFINVSAKNTHGPIMQHWLGFRPEVVEYDRFPRAKGKSRWTFGKKLKLFTDVMLGFSPRPMRAVAGLGVIISVLSAAFGVSVVMSALAGNVEVPGWASLVTILSLLFSFVIIMLAIACEYLWRILDQVNGRPESVVDEVF